MLQEAAQRGGKYSIIRGKNCEKQHCANILRSSYADKPYYDDKYTSYDDISHPGKKSVVKRLSGFKQ